MSDPAPSSIIRRAMWLAFGLILAAPLIAMRVTPEVSWTASDFAGAALLLGALGLAIEAATRLRRPRARCLTIIAATAAVALVWAEGAVGLFH